MKKLLLSLLVLMMFAGCAAKNEATNDANTNTDTNVETAIAEYTIYNATGAKLTDLYIYETDSEEKGENLAGEGLENGGKVSYSKELASDITLTLDFNYEGGESQTFTSLHNEVAPITLKSVDAAAGATVIAFETPKGTGVYNIKNTTGEDVTALYVYVAGSEDKGENYAENVLSDGESVNVTIEAAVDANLVLEFANAESEARTFDTLHIEEANIELLSVDALTGPTNIKFAY